MARIHRVLIFGIYRLQIEKVGICIYFHRICLTSESSFGKLREVEGNVAGASRNCSLNLNQCDASIPQTRFYVADQCQPFHFGEISWSKQRFCGEEMFPLQKNFSILEDPSWTVTSSISQKRRIPGLRRSFGRRCKWPDRNTDWLF